MKIIYLTNQQFQNRMKTISTKNLQKYGRSLTAISLHHHFRDCILCVHDGAVLEIDENKYKEIRALVMTEEFCLGVN